MKKHIAVSISILFAALFSSGCELVKKLGAGQKGNTVEFQIFVNDETIPGVEVLCKGGSARTDDEGKCRLPLARYVGREEQIAVKFKRLRVDTTVILPLSPYMRLYVRAADAGLSGWYERLRLKKDSLGLMQRKLTDADRVLDQLHLKLTHYLAEHPNSAMAEFLTVVEQRQEEQEVLVERILDLNTEYADAIRDLERGKVSADNWNELEDIFEETRDWINLFEDSISPLPGVVDKNEVSRPEMEFSTDIFFGNGEYRLTNLSPAQQQELQKFRQKVDAFIAKNYRGVATDQLVVSVKVVGSADGIPVGDALWNEIAGHCSGERGDGNQCLSELRARSLSEYLAKTFARLSPEVAYQGIGSSDATLNVARASLRKCTASFAIYPVALRKNRLEAFRQRQMNWKKASK